MLTQQPSAALLLWSRRMQRFERSDLTVAAFCQSEGVSQASYYYWRRKLRARNQRSLKRFAHDAGEIPSGVLCHR
jgi:transposase-like protein